MNHLIAVYQGSPQNSQCQNLANSLKLSPHKYVSNQISSIIIYTLRLKPKATKC